jgi:RNA polymerase sigma-70 factor (ECF subfamily)
MNAPYKTTSANLPTCSRACGDERELLTRLQNGDPGAYETLVREFGPRMLALARRFLPCPQDSGDAVQDAFISAFQSIRSFQGQSSLSTWLHRITVNSCLMLLRSRGRRRSASLEELLPQFNERGHHARAVTRWDDTVAQVATNEQRALVRSCIERIPEPYRSVLLLRDIEQLDTEQTAHLMGTTVGNIKTRRHRARLMLRTVLERKSVENSHLIRRDSPLA